jgi:putative SbcD/Mre11-related phosphoesterase
LLLRKGEERVLAVADLHIGWEIALAEQGIHVPSQTPRIKEKLLKLVDLYKPTSLLFLGDVKHTIARAGLGEWRDIPDLFEALGQKVSDIRIVLGNHDGNLEPLLPSAVKIVNSAGIALSGVGFFHGHAWPAPEILQCRNLVIGHVHPTVAFRDLLGFRITAQVWVRAPINQKQLAKAFLSGMGYRPKTGEDPFKVLQKNFHTKFKASEFYIMPCFNEFLGGRPINRSGGRYGKSGKSIEYLGPLLRSSGVDVENAETYLLDGTFLGTVGQLRSLS